MLYVTPFDIKYFIEKYSRFTKDQRPKKKVLYADLMVIKLTTGGKVMIEEVAVVEREVVRVCDIFLPTTNEK